MTANSRSQPPPVSPALRQRGAAGLVLGGLSLLGPLLFTGFQPRRGIWLLILSLGAAGLALWFGISAIQRTRRERSGRPPGATAGTVLGGLGLAFTSLWLTIALLAWPQLNIYYTCRQSATSTTAQATCLTKLENSITSRLNSFQSPGS